MEPSHDIFVRLSVLRAEIRICVLPNTEQMAGFRVCKSVHHHTFNWINQPDAANSQVYYLSFKYSSTRFGRPRAHQQELHNCSSGLWFYCRSLVIAVLLVVVGPDGRVFPHTRPACCRLKLSLYYSKCACAEVEVQHHAFLQTAIDGGKVK